MTVPTYIPIASTLKPQLPLKHRRRFAAEQRLRLREMTLKLSDLFGGHTPPAPNPSRTKRGPGRV